MAISEPKEAHGRQAPPGGLAGSPRSSEPVPYNFHRPDKFSKDHIRSVQSIQEIFSRFTANLLAAKVRSAAHGTLLQVEQETLGEFVDSLSSPELLFVTGLDPLAGQAYIHMDYDLALLVIDRMLGGTGGEGAARRGTNLTEIELLLFEDLGRGLFEELCNAWEQVAVLRPQRCEVLLSPLQIPGLLPSEVALVIRHEVHLLDHSGRLTVCLPASVLEPLMPRLNARLLFANPRLGAGVQAERDLTDQMTEVELTLQVELGRIGLRVAELLSIEIGDVIRLDTAAESALPVVVEDRACFLAQPGQRGGQMAVRIIDRLGREPGNGERRERS